MQWETGQIQHTHTASEAVDVGRTYWAMQSERMAVSNAWGEALNK